MTAERDAYFQAEITRLKAIIERMQSQIDTLIVDQLAFIQGYDEKINAIHKKLHIIFTKCEDD